MSETAIVERNANTSLADWTVMKDQAGMLVGTGFLPESVKTPEQALAIILTGRELGIPPMAALRKINVIKGNPTVAPELMLGLCLSRIKGFKHKILSEDGNHCTFWAARPVDGGGVVEYTGTFTEADAKAAGLLSKQNWQTYRGAMLRARAISLTLRVVAPDVIMGLYTPDEMGAIVNVDGEVIEIPVPDAAQPTPAAASESTAKAAPAENAYQCSQCAMRMHDPNGKSAERSIAEFGTLLCKTHGIVARKYGATVNADGGWSNEIGIEADTLDKLVEQCGLPESAQA